jgi:hypothetical protein
MLYVDYNWDLSSTSMIPDPELDTDRLGWKVGDFWQVSESANGKKILVKVDPIMQFLLGQDNE